MPKNLFRTDTANRRPARAAVVFALALGLAEWLRAGGDGATPAEAATVVLAVAAVYGTLGLLAAGLARLAGGGIELALGLVAGAVALSSVAMITDRALVWVAALALGIVAGAVMVALLRALPFLATPRLGALAAGAALVAALGLPLRHADLWPPPALLAMAGSALALCGALVPGRKPAVAIAFLGWCAALLGASGLVGWRVPLVAPASDAQPSVLLVSIDTLRADAVGAYGHGAVTPNLDELASRGTRFEHAVAPSVYTGPSHASLLTGLHPDTTGFRVNYAGLDATIPTLADDLGAAGFATAAFPSAWTTASPATGLPSRFQLADEELREHPWLPGAAGRVVLFQPLVRWAEARKTWPPYRPAGATTDRAVAWLEDAPARPFFAWVHYFDPHLPYMPPADLAPDLGGAETPAADGTWYGLDARKRGALASSPEAVDAMLALYAAEVRYVDREVGRLVEAARRATDGNLWIVVTADHGESMGEHGIWWNRDLYDATLRVPLLILPPEPPAVAQVSELVRLTDVAPTLLDGLGVDAGRTFDGRSLLPLIEGKPTGASPPAHSLYTPEDSFFRGVTRSIRTDRWKLIERSPGWYAADHWQEGRSELYDLWADPDETDDVAASQPGTRAALAAGIADEADTDPGASPERRELSDEEREQLRALGYIQ